MWRCLVVATHRIVMVTLRVRFWLTQFVQAPSHNHPSAMGLAEVQKRTKPVDYCNVWCLIDNTFWFGVLMRYGRISGTFSSNGQSSSANSARESRNPPPWSIIPSPTNFTSHHWSYLHLFQLQRNGQWARRNKEKICLGGRVAKWSARRTRNPAVAGSSPALATCWICARSSRVQNSRPRL